MLFLWGGPDRNWDSGTIWISGCPEAAIWYLSVMDLQAIRHPVTMAAVCMLAGLSVHGAVDQKKPAAPAAAHPANEATRTSEGHVWRTTRQTQRIAIRVQDGAKTWLDLGKPTVTISAKKDGDPPPPPIPAAPKGFPVKLGWADSKEDIARYLKSGPSFGTETSFSPDVNGRKTDAMPQEPPPDRWRWGDEERTSIREEKIRYVMSYRFGRK